MSPLPQAAAAAAENRPFRQGGGRHVVMVQHLGWGSAPQRRKQLEHANAHWKSDRAQQPMTLMADGRDLVFSNRPDWLTIPCRDQHPTSRTCPSGSCIRPLPSRTRACPPMMIGRVRQNAASSATWPVRIWNLHDGGGKLGASRATKESTTRIAADTPGVPKVVLERISKAPVRGFRRSGSKRRGPSDHRPLSVSRLPNGRHCTRRRCSR